MNKVLAVLLGMLIAVVINAVIIMLSWNYVAVEVLGLKALTFFQALVLGVLVRSLVKGAEVKFNDKKE